jgi:hypothetical protein
MKARFCGSIPRCGKGGNVFADTMQIRRFFKISKIYGKRLICLARRAGFEPATIRLSPPIGQPEGKAKEDALREPGKP